MTDLCVGSQTEEHAPGLARPPLLGGVEVAAEPQQGYPRPAVRQEHVGRSWHDAGVGDRT